MDNGYIPNMTVIITKMYARKTALIMTTLLISNFFGYLSWYFVTNNLQQSYVGSVAFAISYLGFFGVITDLGFSSAHIKRVSQGKDLGRCMGTYITVKGVLLSLFILMALSAIWGYRNVYPGRDFSRDFDMDVIMVMVLWSVLSNITTILSNTFIGKQQVAKAQITVLVSAVVQSIVTIIVVLNFEDVILYALTYVLGAAVSLATGIILFRGFSIKPPTKEYFKSYVTFALPLMFVMGAAPLILYMDKVMIKLFLENTHVSLYWNAQKFSALPDALTGSVMTVLFPAFSSMVATGSLGEVRKSTLMAERFLSMAVFPCAFILMAISTPFIEVFSDISYSESAPVFLILMGWVIIRALSKPYSSHFGGFNKPVYSLYINLIVIPVNIILNLVLIPESIFGIPLAGMGIRGAALATLLSGTMKFVMIRFLSRRLIKIGPNRSVLRHLVAGGIVGCGLFLIQSLHPFVDRFYEILLVFAAGILIYGLLLYLMGELSKNDVKFFLDTINPKKSIRYIRDETGNRDR